MGTIIEFPADAVSRRLGSAMDGAPREGLGTILILPWSGSNASLRNQRRQRTGRRCRSRPPPSQALTSDIRYAGDVFSDPDHFCGSGRRSDSHPASGRPDARGLQRRRFRRTRQDFLNDDMHRWIGAEATGSLGLHASQFQLTDGERQLRDLAYPLIEPPHSRPAWKSVFGDYAVLPSPWRQKSGVDDRNGQLIDDAPHRSLPSRYAQLIDAVRDRHSCVRIVLPLFAATAKAAPRNRRNTLFQAGRECGGSIRDKPDREAGVRRR